MSPSWNDYLARGVEVRDGGAIPVRQDLRDLSEEQMYLYVEGLKKFQNEPTSNDLSYYKIAGIHGKPYVTWPSWNNEIKPRDLPAGSFGGFCTHTSILFLTWHRPYLALFESALYKHVQDIAAGITGDQAVKDKYVRIAKSFRMPYWDWARKDVQVVPENALDAKIRVAGPPSTNSLQGKKGDYNPLFTFPFSTDTPKDITDRPVNKVMQHFNSTIRYPGRDAKSNILDVMQEYYNSPDELQPERNLTERTAYILMAYKTFAAMSSNELRQGGKFGNVTDAENWGSLEDVHNAVHGIVGGGGHMGGVPTSAFDPIFWLHHTNIDRLFDIWMALHQNDSSKDAWIVSRRSDTGDFAKKPNDEENANTPLYPFKIDPNNWYLSKDCKRTQPFGYVYPETKAITYPTSQSQRSTLTTAISKLYAPLWTSIQESKQGIKTAGQELLAQSHIVQLTESQQIPATAQEVTQITKTMPSQKVLLERSLEPKKPFIKDLAPANKYLEWIVNVKGEKHTLDGSYSVHVFLGAADDETNVAMWPAVATHVGTFVPLGQTTSTGCAKCQGDQDAHTEVTGQIPLTLALVERYLAGMDIDLTEDKVIPYLTKNLHWRVSRGDGTVVQDKSQVDGLTVFVVSNEVTLSEDAGSLPTYAPGVQIYPQITTNRQGGGRGDGTGLTQGQVPT